MVNGKDKNFHRMFTKLILYDTLVEKQVENTQNSYKGGFYMKKSSSNRKSNAVIWAIVGIVVIIIGITCLIASGQEAEPTTESSDGWKITSREEAQEELDNMGVIGGIILVVGIGLEIFAFISNQSNSNAVANETEILNRHENRLKELNNEFKENKITKEKFEERKTKILESIIADINTLDLLKKRIKEMAIDGFITEEESRNILEKVDTDIKKTKGKRKGIIFIVIIACIVIGTIVGIVTSSTKPSNNSRDLLKYTNTESN